MKELTLTEKEDGLKSTVAMPTASDWCLYCDDPKKASVVISELNGALLCALTKAKSNKCKTWHDIGKAISDAITPISEKYQDVVVSNSEMSSTVARFFGVNYCPTIYNYVRYDVTLIKNASVKSALHETNFKK